MSSTPSTNSGHGPDLAKFAEQAGTLFFGVAKELWLGIRYDFIPWNPCLAGGTACCLFFLSGKDRAIWEYFWLGKLYPTSEGWVLAYWGWFASSTFWFWAFGRWAVKQRRNRELARVFTEAGLKSVQGRIPSLVFDKKSDEFTNTLRVTIAGATLDKFRKAKESIESNLGVYIDDFRENRQRGTVDIIYSKKEMPRTVPLTEVKNLRPCKFLVGETRASIVKADIRKVPHILIAGQTGGGKSSFLRQFITTHLLNCKNSHFVLIDLKEGLESHLFEGIKNVDVFQDVAGAAGKLGDFEELLPDRLNRIKAANCLDFDAYVASPVSKEILEREFIIVDEAAELFLAGGGNKSGDAQKARRILSDIARRGRAAGVHLVVSTQRPDSRSLDPQVKANLPGVLCFQMVNDASSITVLGNGRATELPPIPGRGIWKVGAEMIEVQTPLLSHDVATDLLAPLKEPKNKQDK